MEEWQFVINIIKKHFAELTIDTSGDFGQIGQRYLAKVMAEQALDKALQELATIKNDIERQEISYK